MGETTPIVAGLQEVPQGHVDALPAGTLLGEYELLGLLGVGGFGMVYQAYDHSLERSVAIKEYMPSALVGRSPDLHVSAKSTADAQPFRAGLISFIAEARLLARFDHPSLVKVYRFWEANNTAYMAMPLYAGVTLKEARRQMSRPPPEAWLHTVLWSVMEALKVLHEHDTLHRDVSPENIFLQDVGPPVLLDLGAARRAVLEQGQKHTAILKVNYAPVEQYADFKDMAEGPWTDLYAVGAVVLGCLCNEPPMPATSRVLRDRMPSAAQVAQTVQTHFGVAYSAPFIAAIDHALVIEPANRTQSVADFCAEMHLQAPQDLAGFDWRQALGDTASGVDASLAPGLPVDGPQSTQHNTRPVHTQPNIGSQASATVLIPASRSTAQRRWGPGLVFGAFAAALGLGIVMWPRLAEPDPGGPPKPLPLTAPSRTLAPASEPAAALRAPDMTPDLAARAPVIAPAPVVRASASARAPAARPASAPMALRPAPTASAPAVPPVPRENAKSPPVKPPVAPIQSESVTREAPVTNTELCADSGFLTRPMCIYRECQKPKLANLPVCIEHRERWEKSDKRESMGN